MRYLLGIDQGGTKTAALICDENGNILGTGRDKGLYCTYFDDTEGIFIDRIRSAAQMACQEVGISFADISALCGGFNGADWESDYIALREKISQALGILNVTILNDCIAACRGGTAADEYIVVCAGTGINIAVKRAGSEPFVYGYFADDTIQGASALGLAAYKKIMQAHIGVCEPTLLTGLILAHTGHASAEQLLEKTSLGKYDLVAQDLAPLVLKACTENDAEAIAIVDAFAHETAAYILGGIKRFDLRNRCVDMVFSGSVFKNTEDFITDKIFAIVSAYAPNIRKVHARYEPVCGAALTLLDQIHGPLPRHVSDAFDKSAQAHGLIK